MPAAAAEAMVVHAISCLPDEACGLLAFDEAGRLRMVYPLTNADRSPVSFTVDPCEHFGAIRHAERRGWEIAGSFHSHPHGPPRLSATDVARATGGGGWIHVVLGMSGEEVETRAYRVDGVSVSEVSLIPV